MYLDELGHVAEVGDDSHLCAIRTEREPDRIGSVVRNRESVHFDISDSEMLARLNRFDALEPLAKRLRENALHRVHGRLRDIERRLPQTEHLRQAVAMIGVFVGNEDAVDVLDGSFDGREPGKCFALAKTGVNEEAGPLGLEQRKVARAARRQYGYPQPDRSPLGNFFDSKIQITPKQILKMMAERSARVNKDSAIATVVYSRGEPWKSTISSWLVPDPAASGLQFKRRNLASGRHSSKSWKSSAEPPSTPVPFPARPSAKRSCIFPGTNIKAFTELTIA